MRNMRVAGAYVLIFFATQAPAADFSDPEWPCIQRKVEQLSIGLMWPGLLEPDRTGVAAHRQLAARLSQRRTRQAEAETLISTFTSFRALIARLQLEPYEHAIRAAIVPLSARMD